MRHITHAQIFMMKYEFLPPILKAFAHCTHYTLLERRGWQGITLHTTPPASSLAPFKLDLSNYKNE